MTTIILLILIFFNVSKTKESFFEQVLACLPFFAILLFLDLIMFIVIMDKFK